MKLIASSVLALAAADERAFADKNDFITTQELWWYKQWWAGNDKPAEYIDNTDMAVQYFKQHAINEGGMTGMHFGYKMRSNMYSLIQLARNMNVRCERQGKPEYAKLMQDAAQRKRRSDEPTGYDYGYQNGQNAFSAQAAQNVNAFFWQVAKWARNEMEADCPDLAWRVYKRADRLRWITMNNWCRVFDSTASFCSWAHKNGQGQVINKLRLQNWFNKRFGRDLAKEDSEFLN